MSKEGLVKKVFDSVADKYDLMNSLMSFGLHYIWKRKFINEIEPYHQHKLLDVAGGTGEGAMDGTTPNGKAGGFVKNPQDMKTGNQNVPGGKVSVKGLTKVAGGHGAEKKGSGPGPVGSGSGDKAGQTSVGQVKSPINGAPNRNA